MALLQRRPKKLSPDHPLKCHCKYILMTVAFLSLYRKLFENLVGMLIQYEDYEEVVTGVYDVLRIFI